MAVNVLIKVLLSLYLTRTTLRGRGERRQSNTFLLAALEGRVQAVTFLPKYTWAKFVGFLWLAFHAGPITGLRRGGQEHILVAELKNLFSVAHIYSFMNMNS